ncbi:MAG TPA: hypothetical protein VMT89_13685 [Candidatus Acidoferrales bacterium]|nr:hypothetical protein [Candidatus Acidoferrales bacterium]
MTDANQVGFCFRERMQGPLAAGVDDPETGAANGRQAGTRFVADLKVSIDDLSACVRDPLHRARLNGTATFPGLATCQAIYDGELMMYVADPAASAKLMRYHFGFYGDDGKAYFLDGTKVIHTPSASPREQVTLYTRIHQTKPGGPVWGAGVLVFRIRDLPAFVLSMRAAGTSRLRGLLTFLGFARQELATPASL